MTNVLKTNLRSYFPIVIIHTHVLRLQQRHSAVVLYALNLIRMKAMISSITITNTLCEMS